MLRGDLLKKTSFWIFIFAALQIVLAVRQHLHINPDLVSMLMLAGHYRSGNLSLGISSYWGALPVWSLAIFQSLGLDPLTAARIFMALSAIFMLAVCRRMIEVFYGPSSSLLDRTLLFILCAVFFMPLSVFFSSDLLLTGLLSMALCIIVRTEWQFSSKLQIASGLLLGLAYLAKGVGLPLGLLILFSGQLAHRKVPGPTRLKAILTALVGFAALALPWITVLSLHYGTVTYSSAGAINYGFLAPGYLDHATWEHPALERFFEPPSGRLTFWEDPTEQPDLPHWSPLASSSGLLRQWQISLNGAAGKIFLWVTVAAGVLLIPLLRRTPDSGQRIAILAAVIFANLLIYLPYPAFYQRYFFLSFIPMFIILWSTLTLLEEKFGVRVIFLSKLSFLIIVAIKSVGDYQTAVFKPESFGEAEMYWAEDARAAAKVLSEKGVKQAIIGGRPEGLYLAYLLGVPWLGPALPEAGLKSLEDRSLTFVRQNHVDKDETERLERGLSSREQVAVWGDETKRFLVFRLP